MEAADESKRRGGAPVTLAEVMTQAWRQRSPRSDRPDDTAELRPRAGMQGVGGRHDCTSPRRAFAAPGSRMASGCTPEAVSLAPAHCLGSAAPSAWCQPTGTQSRGAPLNARNWDAFLLVRKSRSGDRSGFVTGTRSSRARRLHGIDPAQPRAAGAGGGRCRSACCPGANGTAGRGRSPGPADRDGGIFRLARALAGLGGCYR